MPAQNRLGKTVIISVLAGGLVAGGAYLYQKFKSKLKEEEKPPVEEKPPEGVSELEQAIAAVEADIVRLQAELDNLNKQIANAQNMVNQQEDLINKAKDVVNRLKAELNKAVLDRDALLRQVNEIESIINQLSSINTALKQQLEEAQKQLADMNNTIAKLQQDVARLRYCLEPIDTVTQIPLVNSGKYVFVLSARQTIRIISHHEGRGSYGWFFATNWARIDSWILDSNNREIWRHTTTFDATGKACSTCKPDLTQDVVLNAGRYTFNIAMSGGGGSRASARISYKAPRVAVQGTC